MGRRISEFLKALRRRNPVHLQHCSICGRTGHNRRSHGIRRNIQAFERHGLIHPIRASKGYDERVVKERAFFRESLGNMSAAEQQWEDRFGEKAEHKRKEKAGRQEKIANLELERDVLKEALSLSGLTKYTKLIRRAGAERGDLQWIPFGQAKGLLGRAPTAFGKGAVKIGPNGRPLLNADFVLDEAAHAEGYSDDNKFRADILRTESERDRLADLGVQIATLKRKRNPRKRRR